MFMSVGHDEYWSGNQRAKVEAARDAGVNLAFMSGNEVFWKTRWEASRSTAATRPIARSSATRRRTPTPRSTRAREWTGTWRDPRFSPPADGGRPENALTGTMFTVNCCTTDHDGRSSTSRTCASGATRRVASLPRRSTDAPAGILGYEWDEDLDNGAGRPAWFGMSSTTDGRVAVPPGPWQHVCAGYRDASPDSVPGGQRCTGVRRRHRPVDVGPRRRPRLGCRPDEGRRRCSRRRSTSSPTWASSRATLQSGLVAGD